ncbi:MAG TPA: ABC transporter ATP-binding protein [Mycobacteriales bacterium]|nr:ABC transporter ATP-binding protein [Mycobacteriales bacterium]
MPDSTTQSTAGRRHRSTVRSLARLWPYVRGVRLRLLAASLLAIAASCLALMMPLVLKWLVDGPVANRDPSGMWLGGGALLLLGIAEAVIFGVRRSLVARPMAGVEASMRNALYRHLQRLPIWFHDRLSSGQALSRGTTDLQLLHTFLVLPLTFLQVNAVTLMVGCVILLAQQWLLGLILLAPVVPLLVLGSVFETRYARVSRRAQDQSGDLTTVVEESVLGIRIIKGFGQQHGQAQVFLRRARQLRGTELHKARLLAAFSAVLTVVPELAIGGALVLGVVQVANDTLSAGTILAFLAIVLELRGSVESTGPLLAMSNEAATAADRFFDVMDAPAITNEPFPSTRPSGGSDPASLAFDDVVFGYPDAPPGAADILRGVTLHLAAGETVALVGATGSGKTTLAALVPRLHDPTSGRITIDGKSIDDIPRAQLRTLVAVAFEEPTLFSGTVADNVLMGADSARELDLTRALRIAQAEEFVRALPQGAATQLGEQGLRLSGGQRQRLALARAIIGRPRLLVLDDPLSALDIHTEALVDAALRQVLTTTTALIIAHRPSTALLANRVALLSNGRITAIGSHHELLSSNAEYASLMTAVGPATGVSEDAR